MTYETPEIVEVGSLEELTLRTKAIGNPYDGDRIGGKNEYTISGGP